MSLKVESKYEDTNEQWVVMLDGEVDVYTAELFKEELMKLVKEKKENIKINGEYLQYIDSTGLGVLIGIYKMINEEEKQIIIYNIKPSIKKLFVITGLDKIFKLEE